MYRACRAGRASISTPPCTLVTTGTACTSARCTLATTILTRCQGTRTTASRSRPKRLQAIAQGIAPAHINRAHSLPLDVMPAIDHNRSKAAGAPAFFAAKTCDRATAGACQNSTNYSVSMGGGHVYLERTPRGLTTPAASRLVRTGVGFDGRQWLYSKPCCGAIGPFRQAGNDTIALRAAESHRLVNLVQFGSHLYGGPWARDPAPATCGSQGTDTNNVMFWVDLDCSKATACVVSQTAKISGAGFNPEFAHGGSGCRRQRRHRGDIVNGRPRDLSVLLWTHRKSDPPNTFSGPTTIVAGTQPYTCLNDEKLRVHRKRRWHPDRARSARRH